MPAERIIAVDFGTSTSVIRVKRYLNGQPVGDRLETKPVTFNMGSTMVPTLVQKKQDTGESVYFGHEAETPHKKTETFCNFKVDIENPDPEIRARARGFTAEFFSFLVKTYRTQSEGSHLGESDDKERTIISYPVKWSDEAKSFMIETARSAGFPNVEGMDEAQAAIQAVTAQNADQLQSKGYLKSGIPCNILLIDMGAGTTDLVLCRYTPGNQPKTDILTTWPKEDGTLFGGREIDNLLKEYICSAMPEDSVDIVRKKIGTDKFKAWKETVVSPALAKGESVDYFSALDDLLNLLEIDADYLVDRASLESFAADYLRQLPKLVKDCLASARMGGKQVDLVILTGGHSQWYFVRGILRGKLGQLENVGLSKAQADPDRIISISLPQETVALGLAYGPLRAALPKLEPKPEPEATPTSRREQDLPKIIAPMPPVLHTSQSAQQNSPARILLPGKNASQKNILEFYRQNKSSLSCDSRNIPLVVQADGTVVSIKGNNVIPYREGGIAWNNIVSIVCQNATTVGLKTDGTVIAIGNKDFGQCNVQNWNNIVAVDRGAFHTAGLRADGTVVVAGGSIFRPCEHWRDIVAISSGENHIVGLRADGTVVAAGNNAYKQCNTKSWSNIIAVSCGDYHTVGLRADGTAVAVGGNDSSECDVQNWHNIKSISCRFLCTVGLQMDGTAIACGTNARKQREVQEWKNLIAIFATGNRTFAIQNDGSVIYTDYQTEYQSRFLLPAKKIYYPITSHLPIKLF